ncbi:MAG TPA: DUF2807 domain-containing protein [Mucilaginibacter sp.]|jgi:hypothetical protein|nr:DUF2807 domain-containing protein [Mucilaginibacter sp.]
MKKTTIAAAALALATAFGASSAAYAQTGKTETSTILSNVKNIGEIEVHGNVQVYLTTGEADKVTVYNDYYAQNALVQEEKGVLRITSYNTDKLVVWITTANLSKLSVYDNAEVKSFGRFSAIDLSVNLHGHALALLDMDAISTTVAVSDRAFAALSGTAEKAALQLDPSAHALTGRLAAGTLTEKVNHRPGKHFRPMEFASI